jgi:uncharacterized membrane protein YfcA
MLLFLGFASGVARGTCLISELLMTLVSAIVYKRANNFNKRIILANLPGAITGVLGAIVSFNLPESWMNLSIGIFEIALGVIMVSTTLKENSKRYSKTIAGTNVMAKLMVVSVFAGFTKGFFGAGWGPIGIGLFILLGLDPRTVIGSSLVVRLLLDCASGLTYVTFSMVDFYAVVILTLAGAMAVPIVVKLTKNVSDKNLCMFLGGVIVILGALIVNSAVPVIHLLQIPLSS